jgi:acyl-CoA thioesterase-2
MDPESLPTLSEMPRALADDVERVLAYRLADVGFLDMRARGVADVALASSDEPRMGFWIKARQTLPDDPAVHAAVFAHISDWWINYASCGAFVPAMIAEGRSLYVASLNHAIWLHRAFRADDWLYFDCSSPSAGEGRGLTMARVFDGAGRFVASATQECLIAFAD